MSTCTGLYAQACKNAGKAMRYELPLTCMPCLLSNDYPMACIDKCARHGILTPAGTTWHEVFLNLEMVPRRMHARVHEARAPAAGCFEPAHCRRCDMISTSGSFTCSENPPVLIHSRSWCHQSNESASVRAGLLASAREHWTDRMLPGNSVLMTWVLTWEPVYPELAGWLGVRQAMQQQQQQSREVESRQEVVERKQQAPVLFKVSAWSLSRPCSLGHLPKHCELSSDAPFLPFPVDHSELSSDAPFLPFPVDQRGAVSVHTTHSPVDFMCCMMITLMED
eukprot:scaffold242300_cov23-Tisochrysis_lutea.AAC.1